MTLHHLEHEAFTLMNLTNAASWTAMSGEQKRAALETARRIEGRIRELADLHNKALLKVLRKHHHVPSGTSLHLHELPPHEVIQEKLHEIELLNPEHYMDAKPDDAVRGLPENVAYFYHLAKNVHDQALFLAVDADMRHERTREKLAEADPERVIGLA